MSTSSSSRKSGVKVKIEEVFNVKYAEPPKPSAPPPKRRSHMPFVPFRKERFLQANYKFKVIVGSDYSAQLEKADQLVDWDKVEQVSFYTIEPSSQDLTFSICTLLSVAIDTSWKQIGHFTEFPPDTVI